MNSLKLSPGVKLGILGGGQLARMMALAASPYGIDVHIYSESESDPAAQVVSHFHPGRLNDPKGLEKFLSSCDIVTFESEFINSNLLQTLSEKTKTLIFPNPQLMGVLQDRLSQKQLLLQYKIPTAEFCKIQDWSDIESIQNFGTKVVLKQRRFGYDGYGTFFISTKKNLGLPMWNEIKNKTDEGFIAEKKIPFKRELALLLVRDRYGTIVEYPLVESKQTQARCDWVKGPIIHRKESELRKKLKNFLHRENYIGVMAFELFDTGRELLVNEIAPRVHNSGHYTQDACTMNQFQAHVQAVVGYPLSNPQILSPFAMVNLLGTSNQEPFWTLPLWSSKEQGQIHWYGKKENRINRKMGHLNVLGKSSTEALKVALRSRRKVKL